MDTAWFDGDDPAGKGWRVRLDGLVASYAATRLDEVVPVLERADRAARDGLWAAVVVSYEAAAAFDPAMPLIRSDGPLAWVGLYRSERSDRSERSERSGGSNRSDRSLRFVPEINGETFAARVREVQEHIRNGDTYQVNLTFPMRGELACSEPELISLYDELREAQRARYCARIDIGSHVVLSFSPELFFERRGDLLTAQPMKGTTGRGRWLQEDEARAQALAASEKERAENVMIVDLLRNDVGRVALPGTVRVPELFRLERYPTLCQMTSTVEGRLPPNTTLTALLSALFPCGSVTGAPKIRTIEIIAALEQEPRGVYTGAIGFVRPGGDCTFSVAIRTIVISRKTGTATMGVGAGITLDSIPEREYEESLLKAAFVTTTNKERAAGTFELLETMWLDNGTVARLHRHLARMADSAKYFGWNWDETRVRRAVDGARSEHSDGCWRLRLLVRRDGTPDVTCAPHEPREQRPWRIALAESPIDDNDPFLFNKTTNRAVHENARRGRSGVDDVLLWNRRGEITESTIANVVAEIDGERLTPPIGCGLLPGVYRAELLERGAIAERVMTRNDIRRADRIWLVNSLREWIETRWHG